MKLLIITPEIHRLGGVANHYLGLSPHWTFDVDYIFYGKRTNATSKWKVLLLYPYDYIRCFFKILFGNVDLIVINPSLRKLQLFRDGLFLLMARMCRKPVVTFMHGFDTQLANEYAKKKGFFQWCYNKSLFMYTLYSGFKMQLEAAGITCPIELTSTKVANELLEGIEITPRKQIKNILYVARVNKEKGIFITIQAYELLKEKYKDLMLTVCGDGPALREAKGYIIKHKIENVDFKGNLSGKQLRDEYLKGDVYILPTTHGEGLATSVLESMAFGLPFVTRPNGGVIDFFTDNMGYLIASLEPVDYAKAIEELIIDPERTEMISRTNMEYANEHFLADKVAAKYEKDVCKYMDISILK